MSVDKSTKSARKTLDRNARQAEAANEMALRGAKVAPEIVKWVGEISSDPRVFIRDCLWVNAGMAQDGGPKVRRFDINRSQALVLEKVAEGLANKRPVRLVILKARRQGITTLCEALGYWTCSTQEFVTGMVVAHKAETAKEIHRNAKFFYNTDERHRLNIAPVVEQSNERALRFANPDKKLKIIDPGLRSSFLVESADGSDVGRGHTLQFLHGSEVGFWTRPEIMAGLEIALSKTAGSIGLLESTANGTGNMFHEQWEMAQLGKSGWTPLFLPWMLREECALPVSLKERDQWQWESREERDYAERAKLTLEQAKWKRHEMNSAACFRPGLSRYDVFRQEWPADADDAFVASGRNFFMVGPMRALAKDEVRGVRPPLWQGYIENRVPLASRRRDDRTPLEPLVTADRFGPLWVWEPPLPGCDYVVGADVAEGLQHGDDSVACVIRRDTMDVVAKWRGRRLDPDEFGQVCALVGAYYNRALVGIEANGPGVSANLALRRLGYNRVWHDRAVDTLSETMKDRAGWRTTEANRIFMLNALEAELREGRLAVHSEQFFKEAEKFIFVSSDTSRKARPQAEIGQHDDEIMAMAIALQMHLKGGAILKPKKTEFKQDLRSPKVQTVAKKSKIRKFDWF